MILSDNRIYQTHQSERAGGSRRRQK